jgi:hypothetical protein
MFDSNFVNNLWQAPKDNPCLAKPINHNYRTRLLREEKYLLGMNKANQYSLVETSNKKWPKNENDWKDNKYKSHILKYNAN